MENIQLNKLLNREHKAKLFKDFLLQFEANKHDTSIKRAIYLFGEPGTGKTFFLTSCLHEMGYETIFYDAGDIRNKTVLEEMKKENMASRSVLSLLQKKPRKIAIVMDEIDGMNNGDKGGINGLIKMVRPKKTKKQKNEETTMNPIICVGSYTSDKKLRELIKACTAIELTPPRLCEMQAVIHELFHNGVSKEHTKPLFTNAMMKKICDYCQRDLRKVQNLYNLYKNNPQHISSHLLEQILEKKNYNDDAKQIVATLLKKYIPLQEHVLLMNDTDRTCVGLLWHENIIDSLEYKNENEKEATLFSLSFYIRQLENICFADFIDRATFQNQIWHFNEMSSLIKTMKNHRMYHEELRKQKDKKQTISSSSFSSSSSSSSVAIPSATLTNTVTNTNDLRFTKVLTKYTTEHNNSLFLQKLCQQLGLEKKDLFGFFMAHEESKVLALLTEHYDISKLDVSRMYRYLEKYR
jgi:hypothetical protein